jgi:hypothetical protein
LFARLAEHYKLLASDLETAIADGGLPDTFLGRRTFEPFPDEEQE